MSKRFTFYMGGTVAVELNKYREGRSGIMVTNKRLLITTFI